MENDSSAEFHLPVQKTTVAAVESVSTAPYRYNDNFLQNPAKTNDQALFDELNSVSEELIACRNRILERIS